MLVRGSHNIVSEPACFNLLFVLTCSVLSCLESVTQVHTLDLQHFHLAPALLLRPSRRRSRWQAKRVRSLLAAHLLRVVHSAGRIHSHDSFHGQRVHEHGQCHGFSCQSRAEGIEDKEDPGV